MEETNEFRIEKLEVKAEDIENEIGDIELTIQQVKDIEDTKRGLASEELNIFLSRLTEEKSNMEFEKEEVESSIEYIKNGYKEIEIKLK